MEKCCSIVFEGSGFLSSDYDVLTSGTLMNRFHSRPAFSKREIFLKVTFTDYSPASDLVVAKLAAIYQVSNLRLTDTDNGRCLSDREFWLGYF